MSRLFLTRLAFDLVAAGLLLFGLSYWWLGNTAHEIAGTAMFLLLIVHNGFNRRWYARAAGARKDARSALNATIIALLAITMLSLLVTSVLISKTLSGFMSSYGGFTARQLHILAGYWALVIVSVHLGFRWPLFMSLVRNLCGITRTSATRTAALRVVAGAVAACGVWSSFALGIGNRLSMTMTLDWWNFEESAAGFFLHCLAITGLYIAVTYYSIKAVERIKSKAMRRKSTRPA